MRTLAYQELKEFRNLFTNSNSHGVVLLEALNYLYDEEEEWLDFDPVTIYMDLKDTLNIEPASTVMDRVGAVQVSMVHDKVFTDPSVFVAVSETLADDGTLFGVVQDHTVEEAVWGIIELAMMRDIPEFGYHLKHYIKNLLKADGYTATPEVLSTILDDKAEGDAQEILNAANELYVEGNQVNASAVEGFILENTAEVMEQLAAIAVLADKQQTILNGQ